MQIQQQPKTTKDVLKQLQNVISEAETKIKNIKTKCKHKVEQQHDVAKCSICDSDFGWFCKTSPDKTCHYNIIIHKDVLGIILYDGTFWAHLPYYYWDKIDKTKTQYLEEHCIFCGLPKERK